MVLEDVHFFCKIIMENKLTVIKVNFLLTDEKWETAVTGMGQIEGASRLSGKV
jgi:hypothetical protein